MIGTDDERIAAIISDIIEKIEAMASQAGDPSARDNAAAAAAASALQATLDGDFSAALAALGVAPAEQQPVSDWVADALPPASADGYPDAVRALVARAAAATEHIRVLATAARTIAATAGGAERTHPVDGMLVDPAAARLGGFLDIAQTVAPPVDCAAVQMAVTPDAARARLAAHGGAIAGLDLAAHGLVVAGGFLVSADPVADGCDIDLWLVGHATPATAAAAVTAVAAAFLAHHAGHVGHETDRAGHVGRRRHAGRRRAGAATAHGPTVARTRNAVSFDCAGCRAVRVQVITFPFRSVAEVLTGFDIACCQVAFDGRAVMATPDGALAIATRTNVVRYAANTPSHVRRLVKYFRRGFAVMLPGLALPAGATQLFEPRPGHPCRLISAAAPIVAPQFVLLGFSLKGLVSHRAGGEYPLAPMRRGAYALTMRASLATTRESFPDEVLAADHAAVSDALETVRRMGIHIIYIPPGGFDWLTRYARGCARNPARNLAIDPAADGDLPISSYEDTFEGLACYRGRVALMYRNAQVAASGTGSPVAAAALADCVDRVLAIEPEFDPEYMRVSATRAIALGRYASVRASLGLTEADSRALGGLTPALVRALCIGRAAILAGECAIGPAVITSPEAFAAGAAGFPHRPVGVTARDFLGGLSADDINSA